MILDFIKSLLPNIKKDDVLVDIERIENEIKTFLNTSSDFDYSKNKSAQQLSSDFYRYYKPVGFNKKNKLFADIDSSLTLVLRVLGVIKQQIANNGTSDLLKAGLTPKRAILIRAVSHISFLSKFTWDLFDYFITSSLDELENYDYVDEELSANIINYSKLLSLYGVPSDKINDLIAEIPDVVLSDKTSNALMSLYGADKLDPLSKSLSNNFIGSPIYHVRLSIAEWQTRRYALMKDKKKMLELKLMALKLQKDKVQDPKLLKEIEHIENRVHKLEHELHQMEL